MVAFIDWILVTMLHLFNRKYSSLLYPGAYVFRPFGKVSESLKFQMNKIFKEHIKNYDDP
jgi:hypothetical protein